MKKIFVLCLCFCLLFSQNVFSLNELITDITNTETSLKPTDAKKCSEQTCPSITKNIKMEQKLPEKDLSESEKSKDTPKSVSTEESLELTESSEKNLENESAEEDPKLNKEEVSDKIGKLHNTQHATGTRPVTADSAQKNNNPTQNASALESTKIEYKKKNYLSFDDKIRINEILAKPTKNTIEKEFIEFYNNSDSDKELKNLWLCDENAYEHFIEDKKHKCYPIDKTITAYDFLTLYKGVDFSFILNDTNEKIILTNESEEIFLEYDYKTSTEGISWNYDEKKWYEESSTPNVQNKENPLTKNYPQVFINEIFPNPAGTQDDEFIELYNPTGERIELQGWILKDLSKTNKPLTKEHFILPGDYLKLTKESFSFALNNSGDEVVSLIAPNTQIKSTIFYNEAPKNLSYNRDIPNWYWESPTPSDENIQNPLTKEYPAIYLNEILPNPTENENTDEFIEIYNPTDEFVPLKNWTITDASKTGSYTFTSQEIAPQSYFVIYRSNFGFALNNSGNETISLIAPNGKIISSVSYDETRENISLNRSKRWYFAEMSPGAKNATNPKTKKYLPLQLNEILPNPIGNEKTDEFIEIYNPNNTSVNLKYWTLKDASKTGSYTFTTNIIIKPKVYFTLYRNEFKFALNNSTETIFLIAPNDKIKSSISYKSARENISYNYNFMTKSWRWSKYLTPNKENIFNSLPIITKFDIDDDSYKKVYTSFSAKAVDSDNEKLKVRWDFGDGRKSYLWETRHKYTKTGTYQGSLRIQDESEEIIKKFTIIVKKYPKHKMKITKIVPNPAGKDSGVEYIVIKNKSKKKINLKNWSIATGSSDKTIVNHPVNKKLIIRPGKSKIITKKYAAISLPNKTGVIEIRRPNGSVADTKEYGNKSISIPDNASYEEIDGVWQWLIPQDLKKLAQTQVIITQALKNEQILSQQTLESYIAFNAIYNPPTESNNTNSYKLSFFAKFLQKINYILNIAIMQTQMTLLDRSQSTKITYATPLYNIPHATNPCKQPTIFTSNNLHFCE